MVAPQTDCHHQRKRERAIHRSILTRPERIPENGLRSAQEIRSPFVTFVK